MPKEYGMTMDAEQVANYLKLSKSSVYDLKKERLYFARIYD